MPPPALPCPAPPRPAPPRPAFLQLKRWGSLLRKFLRSEDDQVGGAEAGEGFVPPKPLTP